ncbi:hypothetical protein NKH28_14240 [Mesorhizobium sp. M1227]|uniref:hypothetical protein n=1 Tax=Mesorhizobium sp. M1227 TaxID=2957071 RepID=UPI00333BF3FC
MLDRRAFLVLAAPLVLAKGVAIADEATLQQIVGEVTAANFDALWRFAERSMNQIIGLKISCREHDSETASFAAMSIHGVFGIVSREGKSQRALGFLSGFSKSLGTFHADGFYRVSLEERGFVGLTPVPDAEVAAKQVKRITLDELAGQKS